MAKRVAKRTFKKKGVAKTAVDKRQDKILRQLSEATDMVRRVDVGAVAAQIPYIGASFTPIPLLTSLVQSDRLYNGVAGDSGRYRRLRWRGKVINNHFADNQVIRFMVVVSNRLLTDADLILITGSGPAPTAKDLFAYGVFNNKSRRDDGTPTFKIKMDRTMILGQNAAGSGYSGQPMNRLFNWNIKLGNSKFTVGAPDAGLVVNIVDGFVYTIALTGNGSTDPLQITQITFETRLEYSM